MKNLITTIFLITFNLLTMNLFSQTEIKQYVKDTSGNVFYFDEVKEGIAKKGKTKLIKSRGYTGFNNGNTTEFPYPIVGSLTLKITNKKKEDLIEQYIFLPIDWSLKGLKLSENDGMWIYHLDSAKALSKCKVLIAKGDTLFLLARISAGSSNNADFNTHYNFKDSPISGGSSSVSSDPDTWRFLVKTGNQLHYIGAYGKKTKTIRSYQILIDAFNAFPDITKISKGLLETKIYQTKKINSIYNQINKLYLSKYYIEL